MMISTSVVVVVVAVVVVAVVVVGRAVVGWRGRRGMVLGRTLGGDIGDPFAM